jgi:hypothetical protein
LLFAGALSVTLAGATMYRIHLITAASLMVCRCAACSTERPPYFSLRYLQASHCLASYEKHEKAAFANTLHELSKMTWAQINSAHRHGSGYEKIIRSSIKAAIPSHITEDVNLIAFRFSRCDMMAYQLME